MAIYQPRNVQPFYKSIDATDNNIFSMEVSTNDKITAYRLKIWDFDNNVVYDGNSVTLDNELFNGDLLNIEVDNTIGLVNGNDYKWSARLYQPTANMTVTYGLLQATGTVSILYIQRNINVKDGMQIKVDGVSGTYTITDYTDDGTNGVITVSPAFSSAPTIGSKYTIVSDFIETVPEYIVKARENAVVNIINMPVSGVIDKKYYEFIGNYTQSNGVPLVYFTWNLYLVNAIGNRSLIYTNGKTYNANIKMYYDGFKTGQTYQLELLVETEYGVISTSGIQVFGVEYGTLEYLEQPVAKLLTNNNAIKISWTTPTSFAPKSRNMNTYTGLVKQGNNTTTQIWIDNSLNIFAGYIIIFNNHMQGIVSSYNSTTGLVILASELPSVPEEGDLYVITSTYTDSLNGIEIKTDTPYRPVKSANLKNYSLLYENENVGNSIGVMPDDYNITMQFMPNTDFYYGIGGLYDNKANVIKMATDDISGYGWITVFIDKYSLIAITPAVASGTDYIALDSVVDGSTTDSIILTNGILDYSKQKYMTFPAYDYIEKVISYDELTKTATLAKPLPFTPQEDDTVYMNDTISAEFYDTINNVFTLQLSAGKNPAYDYVWLDSAIWDDNNYWVEGGTEIERVANNWWKVQLTKTDLTVRKGGV